jgi:hypothetical protein
MCVGVGGLGRLPLEALTENTWSDLTALPNRSRGSDNYIYDDWRHIVRDHPLMTLGEGSRQTRGKCVSWVGGLGRLSLKALTEHPWSDLIPLPNRSEWW